MKIFNLKSLLLMLLVSGLIIGFSFWRDGVTAQVQKKTEREQSEQIQAATSDCIPHHPPGIVENVDLAASTEVEGRTYYYFYAYDGPIPENPEPEDPSEPNYVGYPSDLIISVANGECQMEHFNPMNDPIPLATTLPQTVARQLTLNRYERVMERIGREGLQARINRWEGGTLWDEEQWALQKLNLNIPPELLGE